MRGVTASLRTFHALVAKEWRDVRTLTWASMALVVLGFVAMRSVLVAVKDHLDLVGGPSNAPPAQCTAWFTVVCALFYAAMVASDMVGGERASRRIDGLVLLPAGPLRIWCAKAALLLGSTAVFTAWCALVQVVSLRLLDGADVAGRFLTAASEDPWPLGTIALFATATLLVSTLGLRGLGAVLAGGLAAAGLWVASRWFGALVDVDVFHAGAYGSPTEWIVGSVTLPALLLLASAASFVGGRIHLGRMLRPLAIATALLVALCGVPAVVWAHEAAEIVPGRPGVHLSDPIAPSPDGRFVAAMFVRYAAGPHSRRVFVLDTLTGRAAPAGAAGSFLLSQRKVWDAEGHVTVWESEGALVRRLRCAPTTGEAVQWRLYEAGHLRAEHSEDPSSRGGRTWRCLGALPRDDGKPFVVRYRDTKSGAEAQVPSWCGPPTAVWSFRRIFHCPEPNVLATRETPESETRVLLTADAPWQSGWIHDVSADDRFVIVKLDGGWQALDLRTLERHRITDERRPPSWLRIEGAPERHVVSFRRKDRDDLWALLDLDTGRRIDFEPYGSIWDAHALADGRVVARRGASIGLFAADWTHLRTLWPAGGAR